MYYIDKMFSDSVIVWNSNTNKFKEISLSTLRRHVEGGLKVEGFDLTSMYVPLKTNNYLVKLQMIKGIKVGVTKSGRLHYIKTESTCYNTTVDLEKAGVVFIDCEDVAFDCTLKCKVVLTSFDRVEIIGEDSDSLINLDDNLKFDLRNIPDSSMEFFLTNQSLYDFGRLCEHIWDNLGEVFLYCFQASLQEWHFIEALKPSIEFVKDNKEIELAFLNEYKESILTFNYKRDVVLKGLSSYFYKYDELDHIATLVFAEYVINALEESGISSLGLLFLYAYMILFGNDKDCKVRFNEVFTFYKEYLKQNRKR